MQSWFGSTTTTPNAGGGGAGGGGDKPDWLADVEDGITTTPSSSGMMEMTGAGHQQSQSIKDVPAYSGDDDVDGDGNANKPTLGQRCRQLFTTFISGALMTIWVYSVVVQDDTENWVFMWKTYYAMQAAVIGLFLATYLCCSKCGNGAPAKIIKPIGAILVAMIIWSIVLIVLAVLWYLDDTKKDASEGEDSDLSPKTNAIMDIAGPALGCFSALYHLIALKCCLVMTNNNNNKKNRSTSTTEEDLKV